MDSTRVRLAVATASISVSHQGKDVLEEGEPLGGHGMGGNQGPAHGPLLPGVPRLPWFPPSPLETPFWSTNPTLSTTAGDG